MYNNQHEAQMAYQEQSYQVNKEKTFYDRGYSDGYKKGFQEATKQTVRILERMAKPTEIKLILPTGVPPGIVEKMKNIIQEGLKEGIILPASGEKDYASDLGRSFTVSIDDIIPENLSNLPRPGRKHIK